MEIARPQPSHGYCARRKRSLKIVSFGYRHNVRSTSDPRSRAHSGGTSRPAFGQISQPRGTCVVLAHIVTGISFKRQCTCSDCSMRLRSGRRVPAGMPAPLLRPSCLCLPGESSARCCIFPIPGTRRQYDGFDLHFSHGVSRLSGQ